MSQTYTPFDLDTSVWQEEYYSLSNYREQYQNYVNGDTLISGRTYAQLWQVGRTTFNFMSPVVNWINSDIYMGAIREDSSRRIWYIPTGQTAERLLYDFNLSVGPTYSFKDIPLDSFVVKRIDSVEICGSQRARYYIEPLPGPFLDSIFWVEGIGNNQGLLHRYNYFEDGVIPFYNCYQQANCGSCTLVNLTPPISETQLIQLSHVSPYGIDLTVLQTHVLTSVQLFDLQGKLLVQKTGRGESTMRLSVALPKGVYFLTALTQSGQQSIKVRL
ncbi:MAG: T9SS type A sorting domain-containing protein [Bacteroidota bacterium]